jgi:hypothetical protein
MKHTKGSWYHMDTPAMRSLFNGCSVIVSEHIEDAIIATIAEDVQGWEANGAILAAAPELLEALVRAERKLSAYVGVCKGDKELTDTILPMSRAAIAKAEGR